MTLATHQKQGRNKYWCVRRWVPSPPRNLAPLPLWFQHWWRGLTLDPVQDATLTFGKGLAGSHN
jgi:hypothetical protein